jgi:glucosamine--fructose-6-phosphate aminotransferase (isomerizing)
VMAHGFSTADFRYGPIAVCAPRLPPYSSQAPARPTRTRCAAARARAGWPVLGHAGECLLATVRGQQLALARCQALGIGPDQPAGLSKVTLTH